MEEERRESVLRKPLPLKNGGQIAAVTGLAYEGTLRALLDQEPAIFQDLRVIAQGRPEGVSKESIAYLKDCFLLRPDGSLDPNLRDVLFSACQQTPDGPCIVSPFKLTSEEAREIEGAVHQNKLNLLRLLREEGGKGRTRHG